MTRVVGFDIIKPPCCSAEFRTKAYGSLNFSAKEFWSDGCDIGSLAPQDGGLRQCNCGTYFLLRQCETLRFMNTPKTVAPDGWEEIDLGESGMLLDKAGSREYFISLFDTRSAEERAKDPSIPPEAPTVEDHQLLALLRSGVQDRDVLIAARRRYWRYLNDPMRDGYRAHRKEHADSLPDFVPTEEQTQNMVALVTMLEANTIDHLEVAELYRELGDFERAALSLDRVPVDESKRVGESQQALVPMFRQLVNRKVRTPVRFRY